MKRILALLATSGLLLAAGCHVHVDKNADGTEKNVKIDTPLGGLHVNAGDTNAADVGLPVYPGATIAPDRDGDKSADIHMGFGQWQLQVKVVNYQTRDAQDKVLDFYQKAMGRYGTVIRCEGDHAVGMPAVTQEGLSCSNSDSHGQVNISEGLMLKAGSRHHQHLVGIEKNSGQGTRFALVELQLPSSIDKSNSKSQ